MLVPLLLAFSTLQAHASTFVMPCTKQELTFACPMVSHIEEMRKSRQFLQDVPIKSCVRHCMQPIPVDCCCEGISNTDPPIYCADGVMIGVKADLHDFVFHFGFGQNQNKTFFGFAMVF